MKINGNVMMTVLVVLVVLGVGWTSYRLVFGDRPRAMVGGPFTLVDGDGHTHTERDLVGRWTLVYFGYTHCPDACPTTLNAIAEAMDRMKAATRDKVVPVFISVDPARDTPTVMKAYAESFGPRFVGLTGNDAQIKQVENDYRVYAAKGKVDQNGDYEMDHSSIVYIMGPDGTYRGNFSDVAAPADIAKQLDGLVAG